MAMQKASVSNNYFTSAVLFELYPFLAISSSDLFRFFSLDVDGVFHESLSSGLSETKYRIWRIIIISATFYAFTLGKMGLIKYYFDTNVQQDAQYYIILWPTFTLL